jgi:asparagine synthase (glutamine-hydrolysing)
MFAFAVWDSARKRLVLGRDRLGKKPLYYWSHGGRLVFASEIKGVLAHPDVPRALDERAIPAYLTFGYVPTPYTFFQGVQSLPPASVLSFSPGSEPVVERYWEPPLPGVNSHHLDLGAEEAAREVRHLLTAAVERRLVSDVPLGAFLSGGIDSSAIVALMAGLTQGPVQTFTIGFDDRDGFDEREYARLVARRYGTDHHELVVAPNAVDLVERLVWFHDQPFGDSSAIPTYLLNEFTRKGVTVALSGDGGDELFAGYERFSAALAVRRYARIPRPVRRVASGAVRGLPSSAFRSRIASVERFQRFADEGLPAAYREWLSFMSEGTRVEALRGHASKWALDDFDAIWNATHGAEPLDRLLATNLRTYLVDDLLVKADRMSMAHALEVRSPFLDTELVEFAARLRPEMKLRGFERKRVLKAAVSDLLPTEITRRRKRGFGVPLDRWFREDLRGYVDSTLGERSARVRAHLDAAVIDRLLADHASSSADNGQALWMLLTLEVFLRREGW